jgi:hypothetical protein
MVESNVRDRLHHCQRKLVLLQEFRATMPLMIVRSPPPRARHDAASDTYHYNQNACWNKQVPFYGAFA